MQALGKTKIDFYWNVVVFCVLAVICSVFAQYGSLVLAWAIFVLQCILFVAIYFVYFKGVINLHYPLYFKPIIIFGTVALISSFSSLVFIKIIGIENPLIFITSVVAVSSVINYILCWTNRGDLILLPSPRLLLMKLLKSRLGRFY